MILQKLDVYNVRNIEQLSFVPTAGINFIYGKNGSGKSSLLEAIFILGRAKSFRCHSINKVIQLGKPEIIISGVAMNNDAIYSQLGIRLDAKQVEIRINGNNHLARSDLAYALPLQFIHPASYVLLDGGARLRREFIDWGVFNLYKDFLLTWRKFKKSLVQRNALLKLKQMAQLQVWNQELVLYGTMVHDFRCQYMQLLEPVFQNIVQQFLAFNKIELHIVPGWNTDKDYLQLLEENLEKDLRYGYTHSGPHRGDFKLLIEGQLAKDFVSRGQLKLLVLALKIAQVKLLSTQQGITSCILIDDLTSELDRESRAKLIAFMFDLNVQVFITATDKNSFGDLQQFEACQMFHVEHGTITPM